MGRLRACLKHPMWDADFVLVAQNTPPPLPLPHKLGEGNQVASSYVHPSPSFWRTGSGGGVYCVTSDEDAAVRFPLAFRTLLACGLILSTARVYAAPAPTPAPPPQALAPAFPVELDADRAPSLVTHGDCFIRGGTILTVTRG